MVSAEHRLIPNLPAAMVDDSWVNSNCSEAKHTSVMMYVLRNLDNISEINMSSIQVHHNLKLQKCP